MTRFVYMVEYQQSEKSNWEYGICIEDDIDLHYISMNGEPITPYKVLNRQDMGTFNTNIE